MAFTSTITGSIPVGNKRMEWGTFASDSGSTGGDIATGLRICEQMFLQHTASAVVADAPSVNETLPVAGSAVTVVSTANADGYWLAFGA